MPKTSQKHPDRIQIQIRKEKKKIKTRSTNKNQRGGDVTMIESDRGDRWMIPRSSLQDQFWFGLVWFDERERKRGDEEDLRERKVLELFPFFFFPLSSIERRIWRQLGTAERPPPLPDPHILLSRPTATFIGSWKDSFALWIIEEAGFNGPRGHVLPSIARG